MASSNRGLRLLKSMEHYAKTHSNKFDTNTVFSKVQLLSASEGHMRGRFTVDQSMCNSLNTLHGGYISSVIDTLTTFAQMSNQDGRLSWTTNLHVDFLRSAQVGDTVIVETTPLRRGNYPVMEAVLKNEANGALVAKGVVSLLAGADKYQNLAKEVLDFDVYEK